ncbi:MAG: inositol-3-phosphate synthase [Thermoprotei archaeon]|jgi:myo-inositol-1-phosphate synthase
MAKINVGFIGLGNVASAVIQGIQFYKENKKETDTIMHKEIGGYKISDIEITSGFDVASNKVGKTIDKAIMQYPNYFRLLKPKPNKHKVKLAPVLDSVGKYVEKIINPINKDDKIVELEKNIIREIKETKTEVLVNTLPVGSQKATEFWANIAIKTKTAMVNAIPVFIASNPQWAEKFSKAGIPIIGDDIKSVLGATIVHRVLSKLTVDRGTKLEQTYQLNVGGNTDFKNMLERERLESKRISKTESVQSQFETALDQDNIHIGPSDYVPFLKNTKIAFIYLKGKMWCNIPYEIDIKLTVDDKADAAGVLVDAIRLCKVGLDHKLGGPLLEASSYLMKHPPIQKSDSEAKAELEKFIHKYSKR